MPILDAAAFETLWNGAPAETEAALNEQDDE